MCRFKKTLQHFEETLPVYTCAVIKYLQTKRLIFLQHSNAVSTQYIKKIQQVENNKPELKIRGIKCSKAVKPNAPAVRHYTC